MGPRTASARSNGGRNNSRSKPSDRQLRPSTPLYAWIGKHTPLVVVAVLALTAALAVPFLTMAPERSASTEPRGPIFEARDLVDERFVSSVFDTPFIGEAPGGDVLLAAPLAELLSIQDALRSDPELGPTLHTWFLPAVGIEAVGMFGLPDLVDRELRAEGVPEGLYGASDQQVKAAGTALIERYGDDSLLLGLSQQSSESPDGTWTVPAIALRVLSDDNVLGFGNRSINLGGPTEPESYSRELQSLLREAEGWDIYGVAIDVNLTSEDQGALAGPFIGLSVLAALLMVGVVFRSYWVVAVVSSMFLVLLIWLKGISNLIGLEDSTVLSLIVPIAMVSFGVDYAFHSIGRYREERVGGRTAGRAAVTGTAAVAGALVLAAASDSVAFLANVTTGIESVVEFGIGAAIALASAWLLLGIVAPFVVAHIEAVVPAPYPGRWTTAKRVAGTVGTGALSTASVLMLVFVLPWLGVVLTAATVVLSLVLPVWLQSKMPGRRVGEVELAGSRQGLGRVVGSVVVWFTRWRIVVLPLALVATAGAAFFAAQVEARFDVKDFFSADSDFVVALDLQDEHVGSRRGERTSIYIEGDVTDPARLAALQGRLSELRTLPTENLARNDGGVRLFEYGVMEIIETANQSASMPDLVLEQTGVALTDDDQDGIPDTKPQVAALLTVASTVGIPASSGADGPLLMTPDDVSVRVNLDTEPNATVVVLGMVGSRDQQVVQQVRDTLSPLTASISADFGGTFVQATGSPLVRDASLDGTSRAMLVSLPVAVLACLVVASIFLRSLRFGLLSIIPILMVVSWLYAFMERAGFGISLVTATIGAISIGIGIDFALHFISRFREELDRAGQRTLAVRKAGEGTGLALVASTVTSVVGFGVLALAPMPLFATYGLLTAVMVALALVASLVVLPSLLVLATSDRPEPVLDLREQTARPTAPSISRPSFLSATEDEPSFALAGAPMGRTESASTEPARTESAQASGVAVAVGDSGSASVEAVLPATSGVGSGLDRGLPGADGGVDWLTPEQHALLWGIEPVREQRSDHWLIRLGIAALLIVMGLRALIEPEGFETMLAGNALTESIGATEIEWLVLFAGVNSLVLGAAVLLGRWRNLVFGWLAAWFVVVAALEVAELLGL